MRQLSKTEAPEVLKSNGDTWTQAYVSAAVKERPRFEKWRHAEIKEALRMETRARCAYCEGIVEDVSYAHVEHIRPKSLFPELAHFWLNLTTACGVCNVNKGDYFVEGNACLDPYNDDLTQFIQPVGPMIDWVAGNARAEITVRRIGLNRSNLVIARTERIANIRDLYVRWHASAEPLRSILEDALRLDALEGEFVQTVVEYLRSKGFPI